jgi:hypothetical protein
MYESLINQINAYIRNNAINDISGDGLNVILQAMLNALGVGMRFYGIATTNTVPTANQYPKFYVAFNPGYYTSFNITNHPKFASGFAIIYDENGTNTWSMVIKPFQLENGFLIDSTVKNNAFGTDTDFFIKDVNKTSASSSFTIYAYNKNSTTEQLVATYTYNGLLSGYKTHEIETGNTKYVVSVNWDSVPLNEQVEFTHDESKFPVTAYVEKSTDVDLDKLAQRVDLVERIGGRYNIQEDGTFSREGFGAVFYVGQAPSFVNPETQADAEDVPHIGTNVRCGIVSGSSTNLRVDLIPDNFPARAIYYIYLVNTTTTPRNIIINTIDTDGETVLKSTTHTLVDGSVLEIKAIKAPPDMRTLCYAVTEML